MSVYTHVTAPELRQFLANYPLGELVDHSGIADGIENTNYRVRTSGGRYVLTLFEQTAAEDLPFCIELMATLAARGVPSARPVADTGGQYLHTLNGRPALLVEHLAGASVTEPSTTQASAVGSALGRMHTITSQYPHTRPNERGLSWRLETAAAVRERLPVADRELLERELESAADFDRARLPQGVIHADLFRDNALFESNRLTGLIDFYYAHTGALIYDLAVVVADWCFDPATGYALDRARTIVAAYAGHRVPATEEQRVWVSSLRAVGLRFWLSRLFDKLYPRGGVITQTKDPDVFKAMLVSLAEHPGVAGEMWH